jgi:hypothetical protein
MRSALVTSRQFLKGMLPYPDLLRRHRVRRRAHRLVTCKHWPGDDATGMEAAQLALLRLLWLQRITRDAVTERRGEDAALMARTALETCIVGLYCAYSGDAIANMSAANHRTAGEPVSYLSDGGLDSRAAIDAAADALSEVGPDLNIRDLALWLEREQELGIASRLYYEYYVPLSHLFTRSYAFALMRHVQPDGSLRSEPAFPWVRPSAARMADGCMGLLAANIADKSGSAPEPFLRYATAHFDRLITPALAFTVKGALRSVPRRKVPATFVAVLRREQQADRSFREDVPAWQESRISDGFSGFFDPLDAAAPDASYTGPGDFEPDGPGWLAPEAESPAAEISRAWHGRRARAGSRRHAAD